MFSEAVRYFDLFGLPRNMLPNNKTAQFLLSVLNYLKKVSSSVGWSMRCRRRCGIISRPLDRGTAERGQVHIGTTTSLVTTGPNSRMETIRRPNVTLPAVALVRRRRQLRRRPPAAAQAGIRQQKPLN